MATTRTITVDQIETVRELILVLEKYPSWHQVRGRHGTELEVEHTDDSSGGTSLIIKEVE